MRHNRLQLHQPCQPAVSIAEATVKLVSIAGLLAFVLFFFISFFSWGRMATDHKLSKRRESLLVDRLKNSVKREMRETDKVICNFDRNAHVRRRYKQEQEEAALAILAFWRRYCADKRHVRVPRAFWPYVTSHDVEVRTCTPHVPHRTARSFWPFRD